MNLPRVTYFFDYVINNLLLIILMYKEKDVFLSIVEKTGFFIGYNGLRKNPVLPVFLRNMTGLLYSILPHPLHLQSRNILLLSFSESIKKAV